MSLRHMHFRDARQRAAVCRTLLAQAGLQELWDERGPNWNAQRRIQREFRRLPRDAATLVLTCWAVWDGTGLAAVSDLFSLTGRNLAAVGELLNALAQGPPAVDAWVERWGSGALPLSA